MKKTAILSLISLFTVLQVAFIGCKPDPDFNAQPTTTTNPISFSIPKGWPQPVYNFESNALTQAGFDLGKKIFNDTRLSRDNSTSCGSCHQPFAAFAQLGHDVSHGIENKLGNRNSPALFNLNWHKNFFWDGGSNHIEVQPLAPIKNPVEMDEKIETIIVKLEKDEQYRTMFKAAFGDEMINSQRILRSLAQFMGALVSANAKYDKYTRGEAGGNMTEPELAGLATYRSKCASCHTEPLFSDFSIRNNGLKPTSVNDSGRAHITQAAEDKYKFKVPSLRNLKYSPPYMHDGRFSTLDEVLTYYTTGITASPTLDPLLQNGIQLTTEEKTNLLAFLNTLNDEEFVNDKRFK